VIRVDEDEKLRLLPLGKVFEIFGPISRPLYTIALARPTVPFEGEENESYGDSRKEK
jgi:rRNA processing protein Gar1